MAISFTLVHADPADDLAAVDVRRAAERGLHRGAFSNDFCSDPGRSLGDAQMFAIGSIAARLAGVLGALGAAVDAAEVSEDAESGPFAARGAAFELPRLLFRGVRRRAILCVGGRARGGKQDHCRDHRSVQGTRPQTWTVV